MAPLRLPTQEPICVTVLTGKPHVGTYGHTHAALQGCREALPRFAEGHVSRRVFIGDLRQLGRAACCSPRLSARDVVFRKINVVVFLTEQDSAHSRILTAAAHPPSGCGAERSVHVPGVHNRRRSCRCSRPCIQRLDGDLERRLLQSSLRPVNALANVRSHRPAKPDTRADVALVPRSVLRPVARTMCPVGVAV